MWPLQEEDDEDDDMKERRCCCDSRGGVENDEKEDIPDAYPQLLGRLEKCLVVSVTSVLLAAECCASVDIDNTMQFI